MTVFWKRTNVFDEKRETVLAKMVEENPDVNEVMPEFFEVPPNAIPDGLLALHEWKYMHRNSTSLKYNPFQ